MEAGRTGDCIVTEPSELVRATPSDVKCAIDAFGLETMTPSDINAAKLEGAVADGNGLATTDPPGEVIEATPDPSESIVAGGFDTEGFDTEGFDTEGFSITLPLGKVIGATPDPSESIVAGGFDTEGFDAEGFDTEGFSITLPLGKVIGATLDPLESIVAGGFDAEGFSITLPPDKVIEATPDPSESIVAGGFDAEGFGITLPPGKVMEGIPLCSAVETDATRFGITLPSWRVMEAAPLPGPTALFPCPNCDDAVTPASAELAVGTITPLGSMEDPGPTVVFSAAVSALYN